MATLRPLQLFHDPGHHDPGRAAGVVVDEVVQKGGEAVQFLPGHPHGELELLFCQAFGPAGLLCLGDKPVQSYYPFPRGRTECRWQGLDLIAQLAPDAPECSPNCFGHMGPVGASKPIPLEKDP